MRFSKSKKVLCSNPGCPKIAKHIWLYKKDELNRRVLPRCSTCNFQATYRSNVGTVIAPMAGYSVLQSNEKGFTAKREQVMISPVVSETMGWQFHPVK